MKIEVQKVATLAGHKDCIYTLEKSTDNSHFFSAGGDGTIAKWHLDSPDIGQVIAKFPASIYAIHYSLQHKALLVGQNFEGIHWIDLEQKKEIKSIKLTSAAIFDIKVWRDNAYIALADGIIVILDLMHWTVKKHIKTSNKSARCIAINPYKEEMAVGFSDNFIRIFDLQTAQLKYTIEAHKLSVFALTYSPDGRYLLSGSRDAHLKIWETESGYMPYQSIVAHMYALNHIAYNENGSLFATCSMDKSIKLWDAQNFKLLKVIDKARHASHGTSINKLLWIDDQLISASDDKLIAIWKLDLCKFPENILLS